MAEALERLDGTVEKILYQNPENGYTVCVVQCEASPVTMVGCLPALAVGETLRAKGAWVEHPSYGRQFKVETFEKELLHDEQAILRYLSGRALRGIGPKTAQRIVDRFGADTLSVLENSPSMLSSVRGITPKKAAEIGALFAEQFGLRQVLLYFSGSFGATLAMRIHRQWGAAAAEIVRQNPYLLCERIRGIGFERADNFAKSLGVDENDPARLAAGLSFALREAYTRDGHVFLPEKTLLSRAGKLLGARQEALSAALAATVQAQKLVRDGERIYLPDVYALECEAAARLVELSQIRLFKQLPGAPALIEDVEREEKIRYAPAQKNAILAAANHAVSIITGGPGTGKTTITRALVRLFIRAGLSVCLAAPTGRAAKRMEEKAGAPAKTLHRTLEMGFSFDDEPRFARDEDNPLSEDVFLIDEFSMVDLPLFCAFLRAVKPGSRMVFIGDADQLPSVGAGDVLHDLISSAAFSVSTLNDNFRQEKGSVIIRYAHEVRTGKTPALRAASGDLFFLSETGAVKIADSICALLTERLPRAYGDGVAKNAQVLCAARRGAAGTVALNRRLQEALNPPGAGKAELALHDTVFREGDRVMQIKNDYEMETVTAVPGRAPLRAQGVFNGDVGYVARIDHTAKTLTVEFGKSRAVYAFSMLDELELAYAVTVHKSQGSEYETVLFALARAPYMLATRALYYTAITRAMTRLILVGEEDAARAMIQNNAPSGRHSALAARIRALL